MHTVMLILSIFMLGVPVMPHHHHGDEAICLTDDLHTAGCNGTAHQGNHAHCCHGKGCLTTHFYQRTPQAGRKAPEVKPVKLPAFSARCMQQSCVAANNLQASHPYLPYIESLHGTHIARATGLMAPPSFLA